MKNLILFIALFLNYTLVAQTWSDNVASLFYQKCSKCHHDNGVAPFSLVTFSEVSPMASAIYNAVSTDEMPPWPPNNNYQQYVHNRALSSPDKSLILNWLMAGAPEGNPSNTPPPPVFPSGSILGNGDLELQIPTYMSKAQSGNDDYVCFAIPTGLAQGRTIRAVEIVPGNREIVHHALLYINPNGNSQTDTTGGDCSSPSSSAAVLVGGYTPGSTPLILPSSSPMKLGFAMPVGSDVVLSMHYPDGSYGQYDSTKVIFHFYPLNEPGVRLVSAMPLIQNWSFSLPPNQVTTVTGVYPPNGGLNTDFTLLSVFPHMHLVGESIKSYGVKSNNDTIPFIDIPHWDFHWQDFYFFKNAKHLPAGTKLRATGDYNNTTSNPHNPNNPPQTVNPGLNTNDEMFLIYFHYMLYQQGDETYDMEELMSASIAEFVPSDLKNLIVYPNPSGNGFTVHLEAVTENVQGIIYDYKGRLISAIVREGQMDLFWNGKTAAGEDTPPGVYYLSLNIDGEFYHKKLIKK